MNKLLVSLFCCILFTTISSAQYTDIINSSKPGYTESPYAVGTNVFQVENTSTYNTIKNDNNDTWDLRNDLTLRYGFWKERLEVNLNHNLIPRTLDDYYGTEDLSLGLKFLVFHSENKEKVALKKSWKRRYGFKYNGLIPSVAIHAKYHTSLASQRFYNGGLTTYSVGIITQNNIGQKLSINNQIDYDRFGGEWTQAVYAISTSYVVQKRWNPYLEYRYHGLKHLNFSKVSIGTPFLVNRNFAVAIHYTATIGAETKGSEFGINASYRIDKHYDKWEYLDIEKDDNEAIKKKEILKKEELIEDEKAEKKDKILDEYFREQDEALRKQEEKDLKDEKARLKREKKALKRQRKEERKKARQKEIENIILGY